MKYYLFLLLICQCLMTQGQMVSFSRKVYSAGADVAVTVKLLDLADSTRIQIYADWSDTVFITNTDKRTSLSSPDGSGIYNVSIRSDTLTRYYQLFIPPGRLSSNIFERIPFALTESIPSLMDKLDSLSKYITKDSSIISMALPSLDYIVSFNLYTSPNAGTTLVLGKYNLKGKEQDAQNYLAAAAAKAYPGDIEFLNIFNLLVKSEAMINPRNGVPENDLPGFVLLNGVAAYSKVYTCKKKYSFSIRIKS